MFFLIGKKKLDFYFPLHNKKERMKDERNITPDKLGI